MRQEGTRWRATATRAGAPRAVTSHYSKTGFFRCSGFHVALDSSPLRSGSFPLCPRRLRRSRSSIFCCASIARSAASKIDNSVSNHMPRKKAARVPERPRLCVYQRRVRKPSNPVDQIGWAQSPPKGYECRITTRLVRPAERPQCSRQHG